MSEWKALACFGFGISLGLLLLVLSAALESKWWNMLCLIPYFILPVPSLICSQVDSSVVEESPWKVTGDFISGLLTTSVFAIPAVIFHVNSINGLGLALATVGNFVIFGSGAGYVIYKTKYGDQT